MAYFYLLLANLLLSISSLFTQKVKGMQSVQMVYLRGIILFILSWYFCWKQDLPSYSAQPGTNRGLFYRGFIAVAGSIPWFYGVRQLTLSEATSLYLTGPIFTGLFASYYLKERIDMVQVISLVMCLFGTALVLKPPFLFGTVDQVNTEGKNRMLGGICCLFTAFCLGAGYNVIRELRNKCHTLTIVKYYSLGTIIGTAPLMFLYPVAAPSLLEAVYILTLSLSFYGAQTLITRGLYLGKAGKTSLIGYSQILFTFTFDCIMQNYPDKLSVLGAICILSCVLGLFYEKKR